MGILLLGICLVIIRIKDILRMIREMFNLMRDWFIRLKYQNHLKTHIPLPPLQMTMHYSIKLSLTTLLKTIKFIEESLQEIGNITTLIKKDIMVHSSHSLNMWIKARKRSSLLKNNQSGCNHLFI